jgi:hypothetical protein
MPIERGTRARTVLVGRKIGTDNLKKDVQIADVQLQPQNQNLDLRNTSGGRTNIEYMATGCDKIAPWSQQQLAHVITLIVNNSLEEERKQRRKDRNKTTQQKRIPTELEETYLTVSDDFGEGSPTMHKRNEAPP